MLKVLSDAGVSTVPPAAADAEVDGCEPLLAVGEPDLRKPTTHTSTAITTSTSTMTTVITTRLVPRFPPWYPAAYCAPVYCPPPYPAAGNWPDGGCDW